MTDIEVCNRLDIIIELLIDQSRNRRAEYSDQEIVSINTNELNTVKIEKLKGKNIVTWRE